LKQPIFRGSEGLEYLCGTLLGLAETYDYHLQAWAVFPNHYHFVALSPAAGPSLGKFSKHFHSLTAIQANRWHGTPGRKVWFQYWETQLTYAKSYFARLSYVHRNAVHHGIVGRRRCMSGVRQAGSSAVLQPPFTGGSWP
jgi:putative transposase